MSPTIALTFTAAAGFLFGVISPAVIDQVTPDAKPTPATAAVANTPPEVSEAPVLPGPDLLWEITTITTIAGQAPTTTTASLCANVEDLKAPPVAVTGPQCDGQRFSEVGRTVSWTTDCAAAKGTGALTIADDGQSFGGDVTAASAGQDASLHVTGRVTGSCTKS
ncbi:DUF3617 domain-containing protein [Asticcacaulis sp.]|uniref:DUF3617 domain-containing protein n=1 Tax=Asticcacaulis sp. TaxID=1872648 RepID=UPI002CBF29B6|nr:DUF3617 family protein [Asticcacaulis sp.]HTM81764.1 DUF3617 family protein [Asticcacaulis sp.]